MTHPIDRAASIRPGTVVAFRFPLGEGEGRAKTRPCLVIATSSRNGTPRVTIAYGTSAASRANRGLDLDLSEPDDWRAAGLRRPSRFVLARRVTVPLTDPGFDSRRSGSPAIGFLPPSAMLALRRMIRSIGHRVAEDRRRGAPPTGQGGRAACTGRRQVGSVMVEYRRRKRIFGRTLPVAQQRRLTSRSTVMPAHG